MKPNSQSCNKAHYSFKIIKSVRKIDLFVLTAYQANNILHKSIKIVIVYDVEL